MKERCNFHFLAQSMRHTAIKGEEKYCSDIILFLPASYKKSQLEELRSNLKQYSDKLGRILGQKISYIELLGFSMTVDPVFKILAEAKKIAQEYQIVTGKPLGITGEVAEYEAARILGVALTPARQAGYDATETRDGKIFHLQIKGRRTLEGSKPTQRIGSIDIKKKFDAVLLVLLDGNFDATIIYEAPREAVIGALTKPGSKSRNERGSLGISQFKSIAHVRWQRAT